MGSKNHEIVPTPLINQLSGLRGGSGVHKCISTLAKANLIAKVRNAKYDGYRLTYGGLDYLALHAHNRAKALHSIGNQIGVGKESDIFVAASPPTATQPSQQHVLKIHRLGRISFRTVKANRDYLRNRSSASWMYLSRLAAMKEYACLRILYDNGFAVPKPVAQNRHTIVMQLVDAFPLRQIKSVPDPAGLYAELIAMIVDLARVGLIHGDFNEFNILAEEIPVDIQRPAGTQVEGVDATPTDEPAIKLRPVMIDFPQMISTSHTNAAMYFERDVACIKRFFSRRFKFESDDPGPSLADVLQNPMSGKRLDVEVEASGFSRKMAGELEKYLRDTGTAAVDDDEDTRSIEEDDVEVEGEARDESDYTSPQHYPVAQSGSSSAASKWLDSLQDGMTVLAISDDTKCNLPDSDLPASVKSQQSSKKAAGWAI